MWSAIDFRTVSITSHIVECVMVLLEYTPEVAQTRHVQHSIRYKMMHERHRLIDGPGPGAKWAQISGPWPRFMV